MDNVLFEYIEQYNQLIKREKKGAAYLDNPNIPLDEREAMIPAFIKIIEGLDRILNALQQKGVTFTDDEVLNGFEQKAR